MTEAPTETIPPTTEAAASSSGIDCMGAQPGDTVSMLYPWSGAQEGKLNEILKPLQDACGIVFQPESTSDQTRLESLVKDGTPPDVAFGHVSQLTQYQSRLKPMPDLGVHAENYAGYWKDVGTMDGAWVGLPVKVDIGTILWYSPKNFQAYGYKVPTTVSEFLSMVRQMASDGHPPFSMGFESGDSTGQVGAGVIENTLVQDDGTDYVNSIIDGSIPYNSTGVTVAYLDYGSWAKDPKYTPGGAQGTLSTSINDAIAKVFSDPPEAMTVGQPGSAGDVIAALYPDLKFGTDYDFFQTPGAQQQGVLHGGMDWLMAFSDSPAVKALVAYLSSNRGGQMWAQVGLGTTPNSAATNAYTDAKLEKQAQILAHTNAFVPEISEAIPGGFANAERQAIVDFVNGANLAGELDKVAAIQKQVLGK
jgi:alpha-glucoside transport system substrate-binding protein